MSEKVDIPKFERGFCPLVSGRLAPKPGQVQAPNTVQFEPIMLACPGNQCALWSGATECCALKNIWQLNQMATSLIESQANLAKTSVVLDELVNIVTKLDSIAGCLSHLEPPASGPSPIFRIAKTLERLVEEKRQPPK